MPQLACWLDFKRSVLDLSRVASNSDIIDELCSPNFVLIDELRAITRNENREISQIKRCFTTSHLTCRTIRNWRSRTRSLRLRRLSCRVESTYLASAAAWAHGFR